MGTPFRLALSLSCVLIAGLISCPVAAQYELPRDPPRDTPREVPGDTTTGPAGIPFEEARRITVGASVAHDSNFFRDSGLVRSPVSETITTGYVGLLIDKLYAQQRFYLGATATAYRYNKNSYLDFEGYNYVAAWYWKLTSRLSGTLSADRTDTPTQFQDTFTRQSNVTTTRNYAFNVDAWVFAGWHLLLGISQSHRTSELETLQGQPDYKETRGEAGIRYLFQTGNTIDALWRHINGDQDSQVINNVIVVSTENYKEDQGELRINWIMSPATSLSARVTYLDRRYDLTPQNDFSGTTGEVGLSWAPTVKLRTRLAATRNIVPWQSLTSNYRVSNLFTLTTNWQATPKTALYVGYQRVYDDYPATSASDPERKDTSNFWDLGVSWLALRSLSIRASVQYQERSSDNPFSEYDATIARISASLIF